MKFYYDVREKLQHRIEGFDYIFNYLKNIQNPIIVETGCMRNEDNYCGDGQSSFLFDRYVNEYGGEFYTVDLSEISYNYCRNNLICPRSSVSLSDSVSYLKNLNNKLESENKKIDLLYLDSMDAPANDKQVVENSARHHLYELLSILPSLKKECLICVDDNWVEITRKSIMNNPNLIVENDVATLCGKGMYINEYMTHIGNDPCFVNYQLFWTNK